jgi:hypothetical protein
MLISMALICGCQQALPPPAQTAPGQAAQPGQAAPGTPPATALGDSTTVTTPAGTINVTTGPGGATVTGPGGKVEVKAGTGSVEVTAPDGKKVIVNTGGSNAARTGR